MGLLDDLNDDANFPKPKRAWCSVCELIKSLSPSEAKAFTARLADKNITHVALANVLKNNGYEIGDSTIGRHRRGICNGIK